MADKEGVVPVSEALHSLGFSLPDGHSASVTHLSGGLTNDNVLVTFPEPQSYRAAVEEIRHIDKVVLRRFCERTTQHLGYDRKIELENASLAAKEGIAAEIVGAVPAKRGIHGGALAVRFVEGETFEAEQGIASICTSHTTVSPLVEVIHRLHYACQPFQNRFDIFAARKCYEEDVMTLSGSPITWPGYVEVLRLIAPLEQRLRKIDEPLVPCHNDMLAGNFIITENGLILIDFELSGMAPASWELGNLISENFLDDKPEAIRTLVRAYWRKASGRTGTEAGVDSSTTWITSRIARAKAWSLVSKVSWSAWGHVLHCIKSETDSDGFSYKTWSLERLEKAAAFLRDDEEVKHLIESLDQ